MSKALASEHFGALADESSVVVSAYRILQDQALTECAAYEAHTVGGRAWSRIASDLGRAAHEWAQRADRWRSEASELRVAERKGNEGALADIADCDEQGIDVDIDIDGVAWKVLSP